MKTISHHLPRARTAAVLIGLVTTTLAACGDERGDTPRIDNARRAVTSAAEINCTGGVTGLPFASDQGDFLVEEVLSHSSFSGDCTMSGILTFLNDGDPAFVGTDNEGSFVGASSGQLYDCSARTAFVSETAQLVGRMVESTDFAHGNYRSVTNVRCDAIAGGSVDRDASPPEFALLFSTFSSPDAVANQGRSTESDAACAADLGARFVSTETTFDHASVTQCSDAHYMALCRTSGQTDLGLVQQFAEAADGDGSLEGMSAEDVAAIMEHEFCFGHELSSFGSARPCWDTTVSNMGLDSSSVAVDGGQARCFKATNANRLNGAEAEIMSFDEAKGIYNFYVASRGALQFHGSSLDSERLLENAGSLQEMQSALETRQQQNGGVGRCAACHPGGGMVMKELKSPWLHWEGDTVTPGVGAIRAARSDLYGEEPFTGVGLEGLTNQANRAVASARIDRYAQAGRARALVRPMFCPTEFNINSMGGPAGGFGPGPVDTEKLFISATSFLDADALGAASSSPSIAKSVYGTVKGLLAQNVPAFPGVDDTFFEASFIERSGYDKEYVGATVAFVADAVSFRTSLVGKGFVRGGTARAIASIDPTRPVTSNIRCGLIAAVPEQTSGIVPEDVTTRELVESGQRFTEVEQLLIDSMQNACDGSVSDPRIDQAAACELHERLQNLGIPLQNQPDFGPRTRGEAETHLAIETVSGACQLRAGESNGQVFASALFTHVHDTINTAKVFPFIEGFNRDSVLPSSNVTTSFGQQYLDPRTCTLTDEASYISTAVDFCATSALGGSGNKRFGGWCFDPFVNEDGTPSAAWGSAVERPAGRSWVDCERLPGQGGTGEVEGLNSSCFNGCRRMRNGVDDQCEPPSQPSSQMCQNQDDLSPHLNADGSMISFCDDPAATAGKDRFACAEFGSVQRLWCKNSCTGAHLDANGNVVEGGQILMTADGRRMGGDIRATCN